MPLPESVGDLVVLHFETNLDDHGISIGRAPCEIHEICWVILDGKTLEKQHCESCTIKEESSKGGICGSVSSLQEAIQYVDNSIQERLNMQEKPFTFVVMNGRELRVLLPKEAKERGIILPSYMRHPRLFDLSSEYAKWQIRSGSVPPYTITLSHIFGKLDVDSLPPINECKTIQLSPSEVPYITKGLTQCWRLANATTLLLRKIERETRLPSFPNVLTQPIDCQADARLFYLERSKVVHISGLTNDVTQSELEGWFTNHGIHPIALWTLKTPEPYKSTGTGYILFGNHEDASDALGLNGSCIGDRMLAITPSCAKVLDKASEILIPFPSSKNRPRPGDWNCPMCGFSNFQRRVSCFRCSFPGPGHAAAAASNTSFPPEFPYGQSYGNGASHVPHNYGFNMHHGNEGNIQIDQHHSGTGAANHHSSRSTFGGNVPFRAGDWKCGSEGCGYHNFAKNVCCLRCGASRATAAVVADHTSMSANTNANSNFSNNSSGIFGTSPMNASASAYPYSQLSLGSIAANNNPYPNANVVRPEDQNRFKDVPKASFASDQGDWLCECGFTNFRRRNNCLRCNAPHYPNLQVPSSFPTDFGTYV
ncbi:RNA-binding protein [Schizosaccharomyces octosporus yFS286]|uniref:RNA-binding protein n=1 Tax=Schizosaccharomyces octosporus (strain yFS286) TaxID=483514 RepID=S9PRD1_SCHOY|nr:RNA-binding protein [Schizosaccharomyces octosporus yFS286]EPX70532.1 RNA-binding protein [Schizosaccharomyces octosporus yFS286]